MTSTPTFSVESRDPCKDAGWDALLETCPNASFFHSRAWAQVLNESYGYIPTYFVAEAGDSSAVLPVMEVNSWLTGRRGITLPFTDECDALSASAESAQYLFRQVLSFSRQRRWKYYELRGNSTLVDDAKPSVSFYGHRLVLQGDSAVQFSKFDSAVRRAIRKAEHENVTVEFATDMEAVRAFYGLLCKTRRRHGMPPQPFGFFEQIQRHVLQNGQGTVVLARSGRTLIAGAIFFHWGQTLLYKYAASDEASQHLRGNNLVLWRAIEHYSRKGYTMLDFGRTSLSNSGLRRFKESWGSQEREIDYIRYSHSEEAFITTTDQASGRWHSALFRSMPTGLSRLIGAAAYKHLA